MSKSKGNVINPLDLTTKYGTDSLRMGLVVGNTPGQDLALREDKIKGYKHFANKLWNIARFIIEHTKDSGDKLKLNEKDTGLKNVFDALAHDVTKDLEEFRVYLAAEKIYHYIWHELADKILEESKPLLAGSDTEAKTSRQRVLKYLLGNSLHLLHPFMPFVTEEIYQSLPERDADFLMIAKWPV